MALYREGKAAMAADGTVTGTGTKWQSSLSLIRPGATIMFCRHRFNGSRKQGS